MAMPWRLSSPKTPAQAACSACSDLKSRIIFTLVVLAICRLEAVVRIPGLDGNALAAFFAKNAGAGGMLGMYRSEVADYLYVGSAGHLPPRGSCAHSGAGWQCLGGFLRQKRRRRRHARHVPI